MLTPKPTVTRGRNSSQTPKKWEGNKEQYADYHGADGGGGNDGWIEGRGNKNSPRDQRLTGEMPSFLPLPYLSSLIVTRECGGMREADHPPMTDSCVGHSARTRERRATLFISPYLSLALPRKSTGKKRQRAFRRPSLIR